MLSTRSQGDRLTASELAGGGSGSVATTLYRQSDRRRQVETDRSQRRWRRTLPALRRWRMLWALRGRTAGSGGASRAGTWPRRGSSPTLALLPALLPALLAQAATLAPLRARPWRCVRLKALWPAQRQLRASGWRHHLLEHPRPAAPAGAHSQRHHHAQGQGKWRRPQPRCAGPAAAAVPGTSQACTSSR